MDAIKESFDKKNSTINLKLWEINLIDVRDDIA